MWWIESMKWWVTEESVGTEARWRLCLYLVKVDDGGRRVCSVGCGWWWWMRTKQEKDEAWNRMRMKDRSPGRQWGRGKETARQRWRGGEWKKKNEGQRERLTYSQNCWCLLIQAAPWLLRLNLHLCRRYRAKCIREVFFLSCQTCKGQHVKEGDSGRAQTSAYCINMISLWGFL